MTWENIDNKAEYKASGKGISYTNGAGIPLNALGLLSNMGPTVKDKAGTTTTSAVSKGTITITDKENQKQDIEKLNRNTENSLNKLKEIFDKTKVEEKQELIHMMNIVGNQIIHEAADHYGWKEGSTEKLLLHGAIGALTGTMSGGNALSGAVSGSVNEFALAYMEKTKGRNWMDTHPDTVQAISTALGAGKMLDIGKFLTTDDRGKEISGMAGSMGGTTLGAFLISSGILNVGAGVLPYPGPQLIGGASIVFTGYLGEQLGHSLYDSYQRKKAYVDYIYNLSNDVSKNDKDEFRESLKQYFVVED